MKTNNQVVALMIAVFLVLSAGMVTAFAQDPWVEAGGIGYSLDDVRATATVVSKPGGYSGDIVIPPVVQHGDKSYAVTTIGKRAFYNCGGLTSVELPCTLCTIEQGAFYRCLGLSSIAIPDATQKIGDGAFQGCFNLRTLLFGPEPTLIQIGYRAFYDCWRLCRVFQPESLQTVGMEVFGQSTIVLLSDKLPEPIPLCAVEDEVFEEAVEEWTEDCNADWDRDWDSSATHDSSPRTVSSSMLRSSGSSIHLDSPSPRASQAVPDQVPDGHGHVQAVLGQALKAAFDATVEAIRAEGASASECESEASGLDFSWGSSSFASASIQLSDGWGSSDSELPYGMDRVDGLAAGAAECSSVDRTFSGSSASSGLRDGNPAPQPAVAEEAAAGTSGAETTVGAAAVTVVEIPEATGESQSWAAACGLCSSWLANFFCSKG